VPDLTANLLKLRRHGPLAILLESTAYADGTRVRTDGRIVMPSFSLSGLIVFAIFVIVVVRIIGRFGGSRSNTSVAPRGAGPSGNAFCTNCGAALSGGGVFCGGCGTRRG